MKCILTLYLFLLVKVAVSQPVYIIETPSMNSAETENAWRWAERYEKEVRTALAANDLNKADYFLNQWDKTRGARNDKFWILKAEYCLRIGKKSTAKRYYMKAYKAGCYECKAKCDSIITDQPDQW